MNAQEREHETAQRQAYRVGDRGVWANAWKMAAVLGAVGIVGAVLGALADPDRFAFSYLFAFMVVATLALGGLFFVLVQFVTNASWGVSVRRVSEFIAVSMPVVAVLAVPVALSYETLYEWSHVGHGEHSDEGGEGHGGGHAEAEAADSVLGAGTAHAQDVGRPEGEAHDVYADMGMKAHTPMEEQLHHDLLEYKTETWLKAGFWGLRGLAYLAIWIVLAMVYFRWSTKQDESKDPALTVKMQTFAPVALIVFGFSLTFAGFDWVMSLEPAWYSTIYGVYLFSGAAVAILALLILITMSMREHGLLGDAVNVEHYHDLGKLMFGFVCFWAYVGFSQWMLIWYASLPEETTYYHRRWLTEGWQVVSMLLILGHFAGPFLYLISRVPKRRFGMLKFAAAWLLIMHVVDMYWFVMPYAPGDGLNLHWLDAACLLACVGVFFAVVFRVMRRYPLVPIGDPRLQRSLDFHQTQ